MPFEGLEKNDIEDKCSIYRKKRPINLLGKSFCQFRL